VSGRGPGRPGRRAHRRLPLPGGLGRTLGLLGAAVAGSLLAGCAGPGGWLAPEPAWERPAPPPPEAPVVREGALTRQALANGMGALVLEDHRLPLVTLGVTVPRGAGTVPPEESGLAALLAEVMNRGAGERDALELAAAVDALGADLSISSGWDAMTVSVTGLSSDAEVLLGLLADVLLRPRLDPVEVERARREQLAAIAQSEDDPGSLVARAALAALYPDHRYGRPGQGTAETVASLEPGDVRRLHGEVFVPEEAVFFAAGDVEAAALLARVAEHLGPEAPAAAPPRPPAPAPPARAPAERKVVVVDRPELGQARIVVAHDGLARDHEERLAADLMNKVLGGSGFSSRLMQRVRADEGLTYGVGSGFDMRRQPGPFRVSTFTRASEAGRVVELVLAELERIRREPPSEEELEDAASLAVGSFGLSLESSRAVISGLVDLEVYDLPRDSLDTYRSRVRALDVEDTAEAARRFVHPDRAAIVVLGPAETLRPQLERFGPVEVVQP